MKFLIDECLSPTLAAVARRRGFPQSTHVTWLGLRSRQDWALVRRAVEDGYVLVTNDRADFTSLMEHEQPYSGLICMNVAHGLMSLDVQTRLFEHALTQLGEVDLAGQVLEVTLAGDRKVRVDRFPSSSRAVYGQSSRFRRKGAESQYRRRSENRIPNGMPSMVQVS